jgi:hypothetical protein
MSAAPGWFDEPARLVRRFLPQIQVGAGADLPNSPANCWPSWNGWSRCCRPRPRWPRFDRSA